MGGSIVEIVITFQKRKNKREVEIEQMHHNIKIKRPQTEDNWMHENPLSKNTPVRQ